MRYDILFSILFELLEQGKVTAAKLAKTHHISTRTVYRYVDKLAPFVPLHILRGRNGGIFLADSFRLPCQFFTQTELDALLSALRLAYAQSGDKSFLLAQRKLLSPRTVPSKEPLSTRCEVLLFPDTELLPALQTAVQKKQVVQLLKIDETDSSPFEPHTLVWQKQAWFVLGYERSTRVFSLLPLSCLRGVLLTEELFYPRAYELQKIL